MKWKLTIYASLFFLLVVVFSFFYILRAPTSFPVDSIYTVKEGVGLNLLATDLANKGIIKSPFCFKVFSVLFGGMKGIKAGDYVLTNKLSTLSLAYQISHGDYNLLPIKVTIPEGLNVSEIAKLISQKFSKITEPSFLGIASKEEGYLFPDTYFFLPNASAQEVVDVMTSTFQEKIKTLKIEIANFKKPIADIIKMASIVEEEGRTTETRRIVAGILWQRLSLNMPLQVDASFKYINGKVTKDLTSEDLKINSPYNSYLYKGLPPTPISNPGLDSIKATITPTKTDYLFFLTDKNGNMHYAKTYTEHLQNKELYLK